MDRGREVDGVLALHDALVSGDGSVQDRLADALLVQVRRVVAGQFPRIDPHFVEESVLEAVVAYLARPERYERSRADLATYVTWLARRRVLDKLRSEKRRHHFEAVAARDQRSSVDPVATTVRERLEDLHRFRAVLSPRDYTFLVLWLSGETVTSLAMACGADGCDETGRAKLVRLTKERLRLRVKRAILSEESLAYRVRGRSRRGR